MIDHENSNYERKNYPFCKDIYGKYIESQATMINR
jgi:hypothetical protein